MNKKILAISNARKNAESLQLNNRDILVLYRSTETAETDICPFCGEKHMHGKGDGHRWTHCLNSDYDYVLGSNVVFKNNNGKVFDSKDGYIVKTR